MQLNNFKRGEIVGAARALMIAYEHFKTSAETDIDLLNKHVYELHRLLGNAHQDHAADKGDPIALAWSLLFVAGNDLAPL